MQKAISIFIIILGGTGFAFFVAQAIKYLIAREIPRREGFPPITREKEPVIYWLIVGFAILGLAPAGVGVAILAFRLALE